MLKGCRVADAVIKTTFSMLKFLHGVSFPLVFGRK
jgi:hypothetical protein